MPSLAPRLGSLWLGKHGALATVIAPHFWCFVDERHFGAPAIRGYLAPPARNVTFVRITRNITNYTVVNNRVFDHGVNVRRIESVTGRAVLRLRIVDRDVPGPGHVTSRELGVYRPSFTAGTPRWNGQRFSAPGARGGALTPEVLERRQREELQKFEAHNAEERARLRRLQDDEHIKPAKGRNLEELRQQHEAEVEALTREQQRERQVLERRLQHATGTKGSKGKGKGGDGHDGGHD